MLDVPQRQVDVVVQQAGAQVDVLFVVDRSVESPATLDELTANAPFFMGYFLDSGLDYHIGVTSTDMVGADGPNGTGGRLRSVNGVHYVETDTPNQMQVFSGMVAMGTAAKGPSAGLDAVATALGSKSKTHNAGFRRADAALHTVVISEVDDESVLSVSEFVAWYEGLVADVDDQMFSALVPDDAVRYLEVVDMVGGVSGLPPTGGWAAILDQLGVTVAGLHRVFHMTNSPAPDTIEVAVYQPIEGEEGTFNVIDFERAEFDASGNLVNEVPELTWRLDAPRNAVMFEHFVPEAGSRVVMSYEVRSR